MTLIPEARWSEPDAVVTTEACLAGCRCVCGSEYFRSQFLAEITQTTLHISALEMLVVIVAVKMWGHQLGRAKIIVCCDNDATVQVINSGKSTDAFMQCCLCYLTAKAQCVVRAEHFPGVQNRLLDLLSRWFVNAQVQDRFHELTAHRDMCRCT